MFEIFVCFMVPLLISSPQLPHHGPQEREEEVKRLVGSAPRQEAEISGFKSELTKKTQSLSAVWDKFSSRLAERERALRLAASFYDHVTKVRRGQAGGNMV